MALLDWARGVTGFKRGLANLVKRSLFSLFKYVPQQGRFALYRSFFKCDQILPENLIFKIADTQQEIEACLTLLHDAYVSSGFMKRDHSGMRVTVYHALPTTTTLCAKVGDRVVGTLSLIRDGPFGFPLQKVFDLHAVREKGGAIAEVSALAVHRSYRRQGGYILFPLMKFMYEYCVTFFDVRHLVIAVNPRHIEMYESLLFFKRLQASPIESYDFVNGAAAVGATLDLSEAPKIYKRVYGSRPPEKNLHQYFTKLKLPNIKFPVRRFFTTNDPVMTPALLDYFFNARTACFKSLGDRDRARLQMIYDLPEYRKILPKFSGCSMESRLRHHARFSYKCPGLFSFVTNKGKRTQVAIEVVEISRSGFVASVSHWPGFTKDLLGEVEVRLGLNEVSRSSSSAIRDLKHGLYAFHIEAPDLIWRKFASSVFKGSIMTDLDNATQFLETSNGNLESLRGAL
jgi:GNAT superfamily N-acetyltransferase